MQYGIVTALVLLLTSVIDSSTGFYIQPEPIFFTIEPEAQLACESCSVEFTCKIPTQATAANLPAPELGWTVNGTAISEAFDRSEFAVTSQSNSASVRSTLRITASWHEHAGLYRCVVTDGQDVSKCRIHPCIPTVTLSREADLTVLGNATDTEMVVLPIEYGTVLLYCGVEGFRLSTTWSRDGVELVEESGLTLLPSGSLFIVSSDNTSNATGLYQCTVAFPGGQIVVVASYDIWLSEEMNLLSPKFEVLASSPFALESNPYELVCRTHNFYPDEISWTKDGVPIDAGSGIEFILSGNAVIFDSLEVSASGNYCCQLPAGSGEGQVVESCKQLSVVGNPIINSVDAGTTVLLNSTIENATINIDCNSTTGNLVTWYQNGNALDESLSENGTRTLKLSASNARDLFGIYQCFVNNPAGSATILVRVLPLGLSNPPGEPTIEEIPIPNNYSNPFRLTVRFTWQPPQYTGGLNTLLYRVSYTAAYATTETLCTDTTEALGFTEEFITVVVKVSVVGSVIRNMCSDLLSEEASFNTPTPIEGNCINEVLFPPELEASCEGSTFTIAWQNNELNEQVYGIETVAYFFRGECTTETTSQPYEIPNITVPAASGEIDKNAAGTVCSFTAAALPSNRKTDKQGCYDLNAVQYSEVAECRIVANVSIEFSEYTVMESSGQATVCVVANGFGFSLSLHTISTGTAGDDDFSETHVDLMIVNLTDNVTCVPIPIEDDFAIEASTETFSVVLNSSDPNVVITKGNATISIEDDDFAIIGFEQETYTVNEDAGMVVVCATIQEGSGDLERTVIVEISMQNGTAIGDTDFIAVEKMLIFNDTTENQCTEIEILDDQIVGYETISFSIILKSMDPAAILSLNITTIEIEDNDLAVIGFEQAIYSVSEGAGTVLVCTTVKEQSSKLSRDVNVELSIENGTALDGRDFTAVSRIFIFSATLTRQCVEIEILDDLQLDTKFRSFTVILNSMDTAVYLSPDKTTIEIEENELPAGEFSISATIGIVISLILVVAIIAIFAAFSFISYKNWHQKREETRFIQYALGRLNNNEYPDYTKASIDSEAHIVDPAIPAFSFLGMESEEEKFYQLAKKNTEETEARKIQQQKETSRVDLTSTGSEHQPPVQVQPDCGEATDSDGANNIRKISDNSSSGISVTSSEYIRFDPSECCSTDYTGRTCDSGLGWTSDSSGLKGVLVPPAISVVQIDSDSNNDSGVPKLVPSESDAMQPKDSSTCHLTSATTDRSAVKVPGLETLVDTLLDDDGGDYAN